MRNVPLVRGNKLNKRVKRNKVNLSDLPEFYAATIVLSCSSKILIQKNWHCFLLIIEIKKMSYFKILQDSFCPALQIKIFHLMASRQIYSFLNSSTSWIMCFYASRASYFIHIRVSRISCLTCSRTSRATHLLVLVSLAIYVLQVSLALHTDVILMPNIVSHRSNVLQLLCLVSLLFLMLLKRNFY